MKNFTRLFAVVLTLVLLVGAVVGVSVSANDTPSDNWVVSTNVSYADDIHPYFAIDASLVEDASLLAVTVDGKAAVISDDTADIYGDGSLMAYVAEGKGVVAKNMAKPLAIVVSYNGQVVERTTYSVAEYFLERLYDNGIITATEGKALLQKELYLAALEYGEAAANTLNSAYSVSDLVYVGGIGDASGIYEKGSEISLPSAHLAYTLTSYDAATGALGTTNVGSLSKYIVNESIYAVSCEKATSFAGVTIQNKGETLDCGDLEYNNSTSYSTVKNSKTNPLYKYDEALGYYVKSDDTFSVTAWKGTISLKEEAGVSYINVYDPKSSAKQSVYYAEYILDENGNKTYDENGLPITTEKTQGEVMVYPERDYSQPHLTFKRDLEGVSGNTVSFEIKMRYSGVTLENGTEEIVAGNVDFTFRNADGTRIHRGYLNGNKFSAAGSKSYQPTSIQKGQWFTLRFEYTYTEENGFLFIAYVDGVEVARTTTVSEKAGTASATEIERISILPSTACIANYDIEYVKVAQYDK